MYKQLTSQQRSQIFALLQRKTSKKEIARIIGCNITTVYPADRYGSPNMGGQIKRFDSRYTPLPFDIRFGYMKGLGTTPFRISINAANLTNWYLPYFDHNTLNGEDSKSPVSDFSSNLFRHLIFGLDYTPSDKFYLAAGYNYRTRTDMSSYSRNLMSGFSFGAGLNLDNFAFGIAYASPHKAASVLMLNLNWTISQPE